MLKVPISTPGYCMILLHPLRNRRAKYTRGTEVRLLIKGLELSRTFLGYDSEITLMEADAVLLGLHNAPANSQETTAFPKDRES